MRTPTSLFAIQFIIAISVITHLPPNGARMLRGNVTTSSIDGFSNRQGRSMIILQPPSKFNMEYRKRYSEIMDFYSNLARQMLPHVNVVILTDGSSKAQLLQRKLPEDILLGSNMSNIFLRDFAPVRASRPVRFKYRPLNMPEYLAVNTSNGFTEFLKAYSLQLEHYSGLIFDGGNVVGNGINKAIITDRVFYDNKNQYSIDQINLMLADALGYPDISIISELQGDILGHAENMLAFIDTNVIAIGKLFGFEKQRLIRQLKGAFHGDFKTVSIPNRRGSIENRRGYGHPSACGIYTHLIMTDTFIFVPQYGPEGVSKVTAAQNESTLNSKNLDSEVLHAIQQNTQKTVVPVPIPKMICSMGGSLRSLTWQATGHLADKMMKFARMH